MLNLGHAPLGSNISANFASEYSPSATYAVNAYCTYQNVLYKCTTAITTPEAWDSAHWTITSAMGELNNSVEALKKVIVKQTSLYNVKTDSDGKVYPALKTEKIFVLSANSTDYIVNTSIVSQGNYYYFIVKTIDGALVKDTTITAIYYNYVDR